MEDIKENEKAKEEGISESENNSQIKLNKYKKYSIDIKIKIINLIKGGNSLHSIEEKYGIDRHCIRDWLNNEEKLIIINNKTEKYRLPGGGRLPEYQCIDEELCSYIDYLRAMGIAVSTNQIIVKAIELLPKLKEKSYHSLCNYCYRFLKRKKYSFRKVTRISQQLKNRPLDQLLEFLRINIRIRKDLQIISELNRIGNCDETPIWFNMIENTTVEKIGTRTVKVKSFGNEKSRISCLLCITGGGLKLPPLIVFKGKPNGKLYNKLINNSYVLKKNIFIECQENAWVTEAIFYKWLESIWFRTFKTKPSKGTLLVFDRAKSHFSDRINELFKNNSSKFSLIPPGQTKYVQPLDVSINKPFKAAMHRAYTEFQISNGNTKTPTHENIIEFVYNTWYKPDIIKEDIIRNSFKTCGISNNLDGSEDDLFNWPDDIEPEDDVINEMPKDDYSDGDEEQESDEDSE